MEHRPVASALALLMCAIPLIAGAPAGPAHAETPDIGSSCRTLFAETYLAHARPAFFFYTEDRTADGRRRYRCRYSREPEEYSFEAADPQILRHQHLWLRRSAYHDCQKNAAADGIKSACRLLAQGRTLVARSYREAMPENEAALIPPDQDPAKTCGQQPEGRDYWLEHGFCDLPVLGPQRAKGAIFWSHGVSGRLAQHHHPVPAVIRRMARSGWDVFKIGRNNLYENGWSASGPRHVENLIGHLIHAKTAGYKAVIAAGQSYGGAISLEAGARFDGLHAILAFAPGHGSDARGSSPSRIHENLTRYLLEAIEAQKGGRVMVLIAPDDDLHPYDVRGPKVRKSLVQTTRPFILLDETMPIRGHGAGARLQFAVWYGDCLAAFIDPDRSQPSAEVQCSPPSPLPRLLWPRDALPAVPPAAIAPPLAALAGRWEGTNGSAKIEFGLTVTAIEADTAAFVFASGAGPDASRDMGFAYRIGRIEGEKIVSRLPGQPGFEFFVDRPGDRLQLTITSSDGKSTARISLTRVAP